MALRSAAAAAAAPRGLVRRIYLTASTSPFISPRTPAVAQCRERADPSTNLFVSARVVTDRVSGYATLEDAAKGIQGMDSKTKGHFHSEKSTATSRISSVSMVSRYPQPHSFTCAKVLPVLSSRSIATVGNSVEESASINVAPRIKFKRLDKTARHIMQILDKEAVEDVKMQREIPDIKPGYIVQMKVEVPENKRRVSMLKGIVIARRNAGLNSTFRIRRLVAGVGVESVFPMYSPNIKEIKVLEKKKVRRAKLYYLRDKMNALKKQ